MSDSATRDPDHERAPAPDSRAAPVAAAETRTVVRRGPSPVGVVVRVVLTLIGAAGLILGAFVRWLGPITLNGRALAARTGTKISARAFFQPAFHRSPVFWKTAGFAMIIAGLIVIVGLAPRSGWLTRLGAALGIVGFVLLAISMMRAANLSFPKDVGTGLWVCLAGAVVALIGAFFGTRPVVTEEYSGARPPP
jgi:hypothetical protein